MKAVTLFENTALRDDLASAHGLSVYLETPKHKILCDMGPNDAFWDNAEKLNIDLTQVDIAFLSHGHYDHSGGLLRFLRENRKAKVYLSKEAFGQFYYIAPGEKTRYIGIDPALKEFSDRLVLTGDQLIIDDELQVFSDIRTADYHSYANENLFRLVDGAYLKENFHHEQDLLITAQGKTVLVAGCAHRGIVNILRRAEELTAGKMDHVLSGFHLYTQGELTAAQWELIDAVRHELMARKQTHFYTGHCTGETPFRIMKEQMGSQMDRLTGGAEFTL